MACVIVMLTGAVCGRKDIIIASAVIAVTFSCAGSLACYRMKKSLHTYHENNAVLENELDAADYQNIMDALIPGNILTTIFTPDIVSGTRGNNEGNRRGKH